MVPKRHRLSRRQELRLIKERDFSHALQTGAVIWIKVYADGMLDS